MRNLLLALLALALLVLAASPSWAGEVCEGEGYSVEIPAGFTLAVSAKGCGPMGPQLRSFGFDGDPEQTIYTMPGVTGPVATIVVMRVDFDSDFKFGDIGALMRQNFAKMNQNLPDGVELTSRKIGPYDALEVTMDMEALGQDQTVRMLSAYGKEFVTLVLMQSSNEMLPGAKSTWDTMIATLRVSPKSNKVLLYGGIGLGALLLVFVLVKVTQKRASAIEYADRGDWRRPVRSPAMPYAPPVAPPAAPPGLRPTVAPPAAPPGLRPTAGAPAGRAGLRSTRPPSGTWSDKVAG